MHVIGTAGHVDHGKSTLITRLTGIDPDRFEEEKRRGLTIDLGFAWLTLPSGLEIGIVDVPGHERFIKNMLAGAGGVSVCLFVVAANEGWMPQSAEHLSILDLLSVHHGVVAVTKADMVDAETLDFAVAEVEDHLAGSTLAGAPVVPVSGVTGQGIAALLAALDRVVGLAPPASDTGRARLWIDRVFTITGAGTVVTGTMADGEMAVGDAVDIAPHGRPARVRSIQSHKREHERIGPGNRVALNLAGLERTGAERGDAVVAPGIWRPTKLVDVELRVPARAISGHDHALSEKGAFLFHAGSAETPVRIQLIERDEVRPGESAYARLWLRSELPLGPRDRFVLRDAGRMVTIAGGVVLDPLPGARRRAPGGLSLLRRLRGATPGESLAALVEDAGLLPASDAAARAGTATDEPLPSGASALGDMLVSSERLARLRASVTAALLAHHAAKPLDRGVEREALRAVTRLDPGAFDALLAGLSNVTGHGALVRLSSHRVAFDASQEASARALLARLTSAGFAPPLAADLGVEPALLRALVAGGELVKIGDFYLTGEQARAARECVRTAIGERGPLTVAQIRDLLGTSRKYAVPLCEWLDATGATRRTGDTRILGPNP